jgi:nitronate monooxygenase
MAGGVMAAFSLGAEAVMMGTRFILAEESLAHDNIKSLYVKAKETDTIVIEQSIKKITESFTHQMLIKSWNWNKTTPVLKSYSQSSAGKPTPK